MGTEAGDLGGNPFEDVPVTIGLLERLHLEGALPESAARRARQLYRSAAWAWRWFDRMLLGTGLALLVVGFGYLVAYNWHAIAKFGKIGAVEVALVGALVVAGRRGLDSRVGHAALVAGSLLVGIFLAVYGQIYQTGADPWELFAGWAVLITGFALLGRSQLLWIVWATLVEVAAVLAWGQVVTYGPDPPAGLWFVTALAVFNGALFTLREYLWRSRNWPWLARRWARWMLAAATLASTSCGAAATALNTASGWNLLSGAGAGGAGFVSTLLWLVAVAGMYLQFRDRHYDMGVLALVGSSVGLVALVWLHGFFAQVDDPLAYAVLMGACGLFLTTGLVVWFRSIWESGSEGDGRDEVRRG